MNGWPYPRWIAHRGAGKLAPENTLAAFRLGASHGYRAFECDVKLSADDVPFLLHDATLQRTTPEQGVAGDRPWRELSRIDAGARHGRLHAGEPIPSLELVARYCLANGFALNIEIKPTPGTEERTGRVVAEAVQRLWRGQALPPLFSSFRPAALAAARAQAPEVPRALLLSGLPQDWLEQAQQLGCAAVVADYPSMTPATIARCHAAGMRALAYTVNDEACADWLLRGGIDGIITDAVDRFSPAA